MEFVAGMRGMRAAEISADEAMESYWRVIGVGLRHSASMSARADLVMYKLKVVGVWREWALIEIVVRPI